MSLDNKAVAALVKKNPILTACLAVSLGLGAIIYTRSGLADERQSELDQKRDEGKKYHENLTNATQLTEELRVVTEANQRVRERSVDPADLAKNLQYFYRIEAESGVKFTDLKQVGIDGGNNKAAAGSKAPATVYVPVTYTMSLTGDYPEIIAFLKSLEQGVRFCRLNSMTASGKQANVMLNLNVDLLGRP